MSSVTRPLPTRGGKQAGIGADAEQRASPAGRASLHRARLREAYSRHRHLVYAVALRVVRNPHDAEDVCHDVFVKLMSRTDAEEPTSATFPAWLAAVARNEAVDHIRRSSRRRCDQIEHVPVADRPVPVVDPVLREAIASLPRDQREVVILRLVAGLGPNEIAGQLVRTPASVNGLLHRATGTLRRQLAAQRIQPSVVAA
jgi:RNA polymerase sigma-70 factor (ECF subfamily)